VSLVVSEGVKEICQMRFSPDFIYWDLILAVLHKLLKQRS